MGLRHTLRVYKGLGDAEFRKVIEDTAQTLGAKLQWGVAGKGKTAFGVSSNREIHSVYIPPQDIDYTFCKTLGQKAGLAWMELRIQEGSLWDYSLYHGEECLDLFSVCPQYWSDPPIVGVNHAEGGIFKKFAVPYFGKIKKPTSLEQRMKEWQGKPDVLAKCWGVPEASIARYLVNWGLFTSDRNNTFAYTLKGRAYPTDEHEYGDCMQFYDFLRALHAIEPDSHHTLELRASSM